MSALYDIIAANTGFRVPDLFRRMVADGVTAYGASTANWKETWKQRAIESPPALMVAGAQVEWWALEDIANWEAPSHFDPAHKLLPFASSTTGDMWCWCPPLGAEVIVLAPHDEDGAMVFAPDLESFLLRHTLQAFAEIVEEDGSDFTREQRTEVARANVRTLTPYLNPAWVELLTEIAEHPLERDEEWDCLRLLTRDEAIDLIQTELDMPNLNETFSHFRKAR
jgi:hypothetical protein